MLINGLNNVFPMFYNHSYDIFKNEKKNFYLDQENLVLKIVLIFIFILLQNYYLLLKEYGYKNTL